MRGWLVRRLTLVRMLSLLIIAALVLLLAGGEPSLPARPAPVRSFHYSDQPSPQPGLNGRTLRVVHLDLKGAPPKPQYLRRFLSHLADIGVTSLLLEYEDMFPFWGPLANLSAHNAYTKQQVRELVSWCHDLDLEVIPLVQTLGHLEFMLKQQEFRHLREVDTFPQEVCPTNHDTLPTIEMMLLQVMELHPQARYLHLGCDEVFHLATCNRCSATQLKPNDIYKRHVIRIGEAVRIRHPKLTLLFWDDMIRQWPPPYLASAELPSYLQPVVWAYTPDIARLIHPYTWHWYEKIFSGLWVAGAFKGATTPTSILPDVEAHYLNHRSWMKLAERAKSPIVGIILTGWSRYDHFAALCELLPSSMPSLMLSLAVVMSTADTPDKVVFQKWASYLGCPSSIVLSLQSLKDPRVFLSCKFEGSDLMGEMMYFQNLKERVEMLQKTLTQTQGWLTPYNVKHNFSSPFRLVNQDFTQITVNNLRSEVDQLKERMRELMESYFDQWTQDEWVEQYLDPLRDKLNQLLKDIKILSKARVWPRRPLPRIKDEP